jgi:hypothetical protein
MHDRQSGRHVRIGIEFDHAEVVLRFTPSIIARPVVSSWPELN